ncbi:hypothetical protein [[Limnothrix rosea] IAM M-220]|uniref:hypothetical protein n=1 Tax=[Limnothrix rosea] IAM M-220 TaxID=454133 RepID=UPI000967ECC7|nr:hypothetical protein [[Limnothrix rosea] IAM M-220]OKH18612.1 hypothetical protein NIES208_05235 [[Limnothrix rosea] IAM M-220]
MKNLYLSSLFAFGVVVTLQPSTMAQASPMRLAQVNPGNATFAFGLNNAKNLARQTIEVANGGLGEYRAETSMHGNPNNAPYVENPDGSYTFTFMGRHPDSLDFTYESEVTVFPDGSVVIDYNGEPRTSSVASTTTVQSFDLNQAKNLARQTAEQANGGLGEYRAEASMHGNPNNAPYVTNADGSYTFTFMGRRPESLDFTYESVITVLTDGSVVIDYNGEPRANAAIETISATTIDLNQAKNLARQAAEEANGGLGNYRAEAAMHGNPNDAPYVENADGSFTFTFQGRRPESLDFTYQSVVTVAPDGSVTVVSNQGN